MTEEEIKREKELRKLDRAKARAEEWNKIRSLGAGARIRYFWDYYRIVLVFLLIMIATGYVILTMIRGAGTKTLLYTCILNVDEPDPDAEGLTEDFAQSIGGIGKHDEIVFDTSIRTDPEAVGISQLDVANTMKMTALLQSAILDVCLAPPEVMEYLQEQGMLLELDDLLDNEAKAEFSESDCLYYAPEPLYDEETGELILPETELKEEDTKNGHEPEQSGTQERDTYIYAVRVDQEGILNRYGIHEGKETWFSVAGNSQRTEMAMKLLDYLLGKTE